MKIPGRILFIFMLSTAIYAQETEKSWTLTPFNGLEIYDLERKKDIGDGFFLNIVLAWQF